MDEFSVSHYKFIGQSRNNKHGGGVGVYVNQSYQFTERADLSRNLDCIMEAQFIELNYKLSYILIGVIYTPPNDNYNLFEKKNYLVFYMGEYNVDLLKHDINKNSINQMYSSSFYPLITKPKRITRTAATLIDNIFLNEFDHKVRTGLLITNLRAVISLGRTLRYEGRETTASNQLRIHVMPTSKRQIASLTLQPRVPHETLGT